MVRKKIAEFRQLRGSGRCGLEWKVKVKVVSKCGTGRREIVQVAVLPPGGIFFFRRTAPPHQSHPDDQIIQMRSSRAHTPRKCKKPLNGEESVAFCYCYCYL